MNITEDQQKIRRATSLYREAIPITGTPGAEYLKGRGIPTPLAQENRVRYHPKFPVNKAVAPAVVFPVFPGDRSKDMVAINARFLRPELDTGGEKQRSAGKISSGVFGTKGAADTPEAVVAEAPIDALSLAAAGIPAFATCGTSNLRDFPALFAGKTVVCAFDLDRDPITQIKNRDAMARLKDKHDGRVVWLKPPGGPLKDWNDVLRKFGAQGLAQYLRQAGSKCKPAILFWLDAEGEADAQDANSNVQRPSEAATAVTDSTEVARVTQTTQTPERPQLSRERIESRHRAAEAYYKERAHQLRQKGIDSVHLPPRILCHRCAADQWQQHPDEASQWICAKCGAGVMVI